MKRSLLVLVVLAGTGLSATPQAFAGQAPSGISDPDLQISHSDRVYAENNSLTPSQLPIPSTTSCSELSA